VVPVARSREPTEDPPDGHGIPHGYGGTPELDSKEFLPPGPPVAPDPRRTGVEGLQFGHIFGRISVGPLPGLDQGAGLATEGDF
jgi:hypothetical protein